MGSLNLFMLGTGLWNEYKSCWKLLYVHDRKISASLLLRFGKYEFFCNWLQSEIQAGQTSGILIFRAC
jgi:hypothetical protein